MENPPLAPLVASNPTTLPNDYTVEDGHLYLHGIDLAALADYWMDRAGLDDAPLTIRYLPDVRTKFLKARQTFDQVIQDNSYPATVRMAYASKANPNEAVIRAAICAGADYECSSRVDVTVVRYAIEHEWLPADRLIIANGFKTASYADALIGLASDGHKGVTPVFDSIGEVAQFVNSGVPMNVGLRYHVPGRSDQFGMADEELFEAAALIVEAPNLTLTLFHALQTYPALDNPLYFASVEKAMATFTRLRAMYPTLHYFDVGGGLPTQLAEPDDLYEWMSTLQQMAVTHCGTDHAPDLVIESGRYLAGAHQMAVFRHDRTKLIGGTPYYVITGGIMSNLPDVWGLGIEFPVVPLNHWDSPFQQVRLAGLTCDSDDVYPAPKNGKFVSLPTQTDGLLVAFLQIGAYQDMLGGEGGAKHCLLSEGATILIGDDPDQPSRISYRPPQATEAVLRHIGYGSEHYSAF
jgi:arginine decarboxylase